MTDSTMRALDAAPKQTGAVSGSDDELGRSARKAWQDEGGTGSVGRRRTRGSSVRLFGCRRGGSGPG